MSSSHPEEKRRQRGGQSERAGGGAALTGHPVVVQFSPQVLLSGQQRLQGELQLLPVERLLHAQILRSNRRSVTS